MRNIAAPRLGDVCPFLELPAEVRNRIYEYALGGHNLHMFARDYENYWSRPDWAVTRYDYNNSENQAREPFYFQYSICQCPGSDAAMYERSLATEDVILAIRKSETNEPGQPRKSFFVRSYLTRHASCLDIRQWSYRKVPFRERPARLSMALLRTCKQIYNEACLVPYYDNTFSFASGKDLDVFVNAVLQPKQREVIQHLQYTVDELAAYHGRGSATRGLSLGIKPSVERKYIDNTILCGLKPSTVELLVGLESLDIALENVQWGCNRFDHRLPRFLKQGLTIRVLARDGVHEYDRHRDMAAKLEWGLAKSTADVKNDAEALKQLRAIHGESF